ncbi:MULTISPECIES: RnfABCDGE type electron transport complex subunit B [unclassified Candidatus Frackibacter]|uniref:RnfABCDGE type electron transport complex subunit B n=1 Tax=unclassified Candidatus Frackibacter TaxID=2648818 RepID=UPI00079CCF89|nr:MULTISPECIES: RnfABCDGE type electron transport complex subunit B [unclassified Candidatus Frackibacter]KXS37601.1 MAG: RnfABCDGE type electron transport complex subunit B [Candidatus Frackibacter sp. T328-2]SDC41692.1 electron transport complex, RnfABCDGE type, B subunit [Candidatus Frackibacter sp. WG11]SEM59328.1 electron transport complex, RnfABCDGE type, B subunit [Candidatus Frackibacter sp. WG12]SFL62757.1 electron transport complex, RnfABCDGE type, B subunit [Candidatus Frackibacter 
MDYFSLLKTAVPSMGILGAAFAGGLTIASVKLAVETDPRIEEIEDALPGANCGACGEPGCGSFAEAVVSGGAKADGCPVGGSEVADKIAEIMGADAGQESVRSLARVLCRGGNQETFARSEYRGIQSCKAADIASSGSKSCSYGCLGFGDCAVICPFDAIEMNDNGLPVIIDEKCTGCGNCVDECPKEIITLAPEDKEVHIRCSSHNEGKTVKSICEVGCIGCGICAKKCPVDAITMENNLAVLDYGDCINCGACVKACPMDTIETIETDAKSKKQKTKNKKKKKANKEDSNPELKVVESKSEEEDDSSIEENDSTTEDDNNESAESECSISITDECVGCTVCVEECPVEAINGEAGELHEIDPEACIECENCVAACPKEAIITD